MAAPQCLPCLSCARATVGPETSLCLAGRSFGGHRASQHPRPPPPARGDSVTPAERTWAEPPTRLRLHCRVPALRPTHFKLRSDPLVPETRANTPGCPRLTGWTRLPHPRLRTQHTGEGGHSAPRSWARCAGVGGLGEDPRGVSPGCWPSVRRVLRHAWDRAQSSYSLKGRPSLVRRSCRETPWGWGSRIQGAGNWEGFTGQGPPPTRCVCSSPRTTGWGSPGIHTTGTGGEWTVQIPVHSQRKRKTRNSVETAWRPLREQVRNYHPLQPLREQVRNCPLLQPLREAGAELLSAPATPLKSEVLKM